MILICVEIGAVDLWVVCIFLVERDGGRGERREGRGIVLLRFSDNNMRLPLETFTL